MPDPPEIKPPRQGFTTMAISYTKELIKRSHDLVKKLISEGLPRETVIERMREQVGALPPRVLARLFDIGAGRPIKDDFGPDDLEAQKATAKDTFELLLKKPRTDLIPGFIVRFMGANWYVSSMPGKKIVIRRIL